MPKFTFTNAAGETSTFELDKPIGITSDFIEAWVSDVSRTNKEKEKLQELIHFAQEEAASKFNQALDLGELKAISSTQYEFPILRNKFVETFLPDSFPKPVKKVVKKVSVSEKLLALLNKK